MGGHTESYRPFDCRLDESPTAEVGIKIRPRRRGVLGSEEATKYTKLKSVAHFQSMQGSKSQWCLNAVQTGFGGAHVRVPYITRNEKAAVGIVAHPCQDDDSSRSSNTRFGMTLFPNMRLARASTSGHLTRSGGSVEGVRSSSSVRMISTNLRRSRAGNALTCSTSSAVLMK